MYVFQMCDASWRIARYTNTRAPYPIAILPRNIYDAVYRTEADARRGVAHIQELERSHPHWFAPFREAAHV